MIYELYKLTEVLNGIRKVIACGSYMEMHTLKKAFKSRATYIEQIKH